MNGVAVWVLFVDEKMGREVHDDRMAQAFCKTVVSHLEGERKDMDVAAFGADGYNFVGFLIVRCVMTVLALNGDTHGVKNCGADSFLVEHCGLNLDAAVEEFAVSTPPGIYSRHYLTVCACLTVAGEPADMILNCAVLVFYIGTY